MEVNAHFCLVSLNWASVTHHRRDPDRHRPCHAIFHEKQVPACLLAERGQVTTGRVTPHTLDLKSLAFLAAFLTTPDTLLLGNSLLASSVCNFLIIWFSKSSIVCWTRLLWMGHVYPFSNSRGNRTNTAFWLLLGEGVNFTKWFGEDRLLVKHIFQTKRKNRCESFKISKKFYARGRLICPIYPQFSDDIHLENNFSHFKENPPLTPCSPPPMAPLITFLYSKTHSKSCV